MALGLNRRTFAVGLATLLIGFFMVGEVTAKDRKSKASKSRGQLTVVEKVDAPNRLLMTGGKTYFVPQSADLEDAAGNKISLSQIRGVGTRTSADLVEIWTRQSGRNGQPEIKRLQVKPGMSF